MRRLPSFRPLLLLALLAACGAIYSGSAWAQGGSDRNVPTLEEKIGSLESKVIFLEGEVALLRERLEALLGESPDERIRIVPVADSPVRGATGGAGSMLTLVMFGDYQSDYTARAHHAVSRLLKSFPNRVRAVFKHYPLTQLHPLANEAALAALAAERQGRFWEYHDQLFLNYRRLDSSMLLVLAEQVGLDLSRFNQDRRSLWALERLAGDEKLATSLGVKGLPTLYLNGRMLPTWRYDYLESQIEKLGG